MTALNDMLMFAREAFALSGNAAVEIFPLEGRGSDRIFYRLKWYGTNSAILIHYDSNRTENNYYADIAVFLHQINIPVPKLIRHNPDQSFIIMEDLGDRDLFSLKEYPWEARRNLYQKVIDSIHRLHSFPEKDFPWERVRLMEGFNQDLYRWERDYFKDHFVKKVCGIELEEMFAYELEGELSRLSDALLSMPYSFIHRDLQSQNIMIYNDEPFFIDFQGMRPGCPFYDLGSLLCDPYVNLSFDEQYELLLFYYTLTKREMDFKNFQNLFLEASIQRLMQALGAYGFLGVTKGLKHFLEYIPSGLTQLFRATSHIPSVPILNELVIECQKAVEKHGLNEKE